MTRKIYDFICGECPPIQPPKAVFVIEKMMYAFLFFFPCLTSVVAILKVLLFYQIEYPVQYKLVFILAICIAVGTIFFCYSWNVGTETKSKDSRLSMLIAISIAAFLVRILCACLLNGVPENDFLSAYQCAIDPDSHRSTIEYVYYYAVYAAVVNILMQILGSTSAFVGMLLNAFVTSMIPLILFLAIRRFTESDFAALLAAILYAFFPSMVLYTVCIAGENISQFFFALAFLALVYSWSAERLKKKKNFWKYTLLACLSFSLVNLFKPIEQIILIVLLVEELVYRVIPAIVNFFCCKNSLVVLKAIVTSGTILVLFLVMNIVAFNAGKWLVKERFDVEIRQGYYGANAFPEIAFFGLKKEGGGIWDADVKQMQLSIIESANSLDEAYEIMMGELSEEIKENPADFLNLLHKKMLISWSDEWAFGYYASVPEEGRSSLMDMPSSYFALIVVPRVYICVLYLFCMIGFALRVFMKSTEWHREQGLVAMFFGMFTVIFLILEAHARYKSTFMPLLCVMAALGVYSAQSAMKTFEKTDRKVDSKNRE